MAIVDLGQSISGLTWGTLPANRQLAERVLCSETQIPNSECWLSIDLCDCSYNRRGFKDFSELLPIHRCLIGAESLAMLGFPVNDPR